MRTLIHRLLAAVLFAPALGLAAEFRALAWQDSLDGVLCSASPRETEMRVTSNAFTAWQEINPAKEPLVFSRRPAPAPAGTPGGLHPASEVIARVEWPEGLKRGLLLFVPAPAGASTPYNVVLIPERAADAPPPAAQVFNYSAVTVAVQVGTQATERLAPLAILGSDERPPDGVAMLSLRLAEQGGDGWRVVVNRNIALPPDRVAYIFLRNAAPNPEEPNNPRLDYKLIYARITPVLFKGN